MEIAKIIIEGGHLLRGAIAANLAILALPDASIQVLCWNQPVLFVPPKTEIIQESIPDDYYIQFDQILRNSKTYLVLPCTQRGHIIANTYSDRHVVLADTSLTNLDAFDKIGLKTRFHAVKEYLLPTLKPTLSMIKFPAIAKPRTGHSSSGIVVLRNAVDLESLENVESYLLEPYIGDNLEEYSLTVCSKYGKFRWMCVRRLALSQGRTVFCSTVISAHILDWISKIVPILPIKNIVNLQFACHHGRNWIFDINPRFGFSELYRTCFGFNFISEY